MTNLLDELKELMVTKSLLDHTWLAYQASRAALLAKATDPSLDTSCLNGYVSVAHRKSKLDVPELTELRLQISEAVAKLCEDNAEAIYAAQIAAQEADEKLSSLMSSPEIADLEQKAAYLEHRVAQSQPERTASLIIGKRARSLI